MRKFEITEQQVGEITGRLNAISVQGLLTPQGQMNASFIAGAQTVLDEIAKQEIVTDDNVVAMPAKNGLATVGE